MKHPGSNRLRRGVVILSVSLWLVTAVGGAAQAGPSGLLVCNATGVVNIIAAPPGPFADQWTVAVKGSCTDASLTTFIVDATGFGTSDSLGRCDRTLFVQNLHLNMTISLTSVADQSNTVLTESWEGPLTTFPIATPFLLEDGGLQSDNDIVGGGVIFTHIAGKCPPLGTPAANIYWTRQI
jgi:hypothetical protein